MWKDTIEISHKEKIYILDIKNPNELKNYEFDKIIIASLVGMYDIPKQLT